MAQRSGLSFFWYGKVIALMLVSFELCMMLTNKRKSVSILGMMLIVFSSATQWWNITDFVIWGGLALVLLDKFMITEKYITKLLCALGIFIGAISYVFIMYPAWQLTYGYTLIPIFIWVIWKNRKTYKLNFKDIAIIFVVILLVACIGIRYYITSKDVLNTVTNTDYPGERFEIGGGGKIALFSYIYSIFFPYDKTIENPCELSGMLSIYPIPMIVALIFIIRNKDRKNHLSFIIPALIIGILLSVWSLMPTNKILAKITFLYMVPGSRAIVPLGFLQIILMIYVMGNVKKDDKIITNKYVACLITIISSILLMKIAINTDVSGVLGNLRSYICGIILTIEVYCLFTINKQSSQRIIIASLIPIAIIMGAPVNPIQKGIRVLTDKPIAKEVQTLVKNDKENNLWLSEIFPNYFLASGARVLNSVNTYPNFDMYKTILKDKYESEEYRKIYNRYAHIYLQILPQSEESTIELVQADVVLIKINPQTIKDLGVKYIIERNNLEQFTTETVEFEKIYDEDGLFIFKVNY